jgi:hypothetical protein
MLPKQTVLILLFIILSAFSSQVNKHQVTKWVVMQGGFLKVDGSTNVNKFNCVVANYAKSDTVFIYKNSANELLYLSGAIKLDVQNFNCHNPVMTSDLRKTLKAREYPKLIIRFQNLSKYPNLNVGQDIIKGAVTIELAGVTKRFEVDYKIISAGEDVINLIGSRQVKFSDFNIIPPRKIGGMIQTNNELNVVFNLRMKVFD